MSDDKKAKQDICLHDVSGVQPVSGWYECKKCGKKLREKEVKVLKGDTSELPNGVTKIGGLTVNKTDEQTMTMHVSEPDYPNLESPKTEEKAKKEPKPKKEKVVYEPVTLSSGKVVTAPTCTITCVECGAERIIKIQDKFQVTRCIPCQNKYRRKKTYENKKAKVAEAKANAAPAATDNTAPAQA